MRWGKACISGSFAMLGLLIGGCASDGIDQSAIARLKAQREAHGIFNYVKPDLATHTIEFTYGSPAVRRMSFDDFETFVQDRVKGQTIAFGAGFAPKPIFQIEYYGPDSRVALWYPGNDTAVLGTFRTRQSEDPVNAFGDRPQVQICFAYEGEPESCESAYAFIARIGGKKPGDVFNLSGGKVPTVMDAKTPASWPDGSPLFPNKAPHS